MTDGGPDLVTVPAGPFIYGPEACHERLEMAPPPRPRQTIILDRFQIGRSPVTNAEWRAFLDETGHRWDGTWWRVDRTTRFTWRRAFVPCPDFPVGHDRHPVVDVSQADALAYCTWLSSRSGLRCGLPTEEQWEKAARGTDGRPYPWGHRRPRPDVAWQRRFPVGPETYLFGLVVPPRREWARAGWYWRNGTTWPVGRAAQNMSPFGCVDMSGNIWEWTTSRYHPDNGDFHVVKGGSWGYSVHHTRLNVRSACSVTTPSRVYRAQGTGFRIVVTDEGDGDRRAPSGRDGGNRGGG